MKRDYYRNYLKKRIVEKHVILNLTKKIIWRTKKEIRNAPVSDLNHFRIHGLNSFKHKLNATNPRNIFEIENYPERIRGIAGERIPSRSIFEIFILQSTLTLNQ